MLAKRFLIFALLFGAVIINAQNFTIKGKVTSTENQALEYATVSVQQPETLNEITGTVTDANGAFSVEVPSGSYILYIESFSGNSIEKPLEVSKNDNLGTIKLQGESVVALEGVKITGNNQTYRMELDKKVYDLSKDALAKGVSLSQALENVPSVQVDGDGTVSLRGSENVRILVDGKPSALINSSDPAQALKNLPADVVERIEVVTNPSARYDAEGSAGIINIILKKGKLKGFNGSVSVNGGIPKTAGISANLNYRTGKWNHFTNLGYRYAEWENERSSYTTRFDAVGTPRYEEMDGEGTWLRNGYNFMLGTEYAMDDKNTFTISGNFNNGNNSNKSDLNYWDFDADLNQTAFSARTQREDSDEYSLEGSFNYRHQFNDKGHELTMDAKANYSEEIEDGIFKENGDFVNSTERAINKEYQNRTTISADYVYPFGEKGKFELGARGDFNGTLTDFKVDSLAGNDWNSKPEFSNRTDNQQNVYAAYAQYGRAFGKFSFFAGMRMENSDITVKSIYNNSTIKKNYVDFFPSLFLNYEFANTDQLQLSYSRRIRRPGGWDLIPYTSYSDNRNMRTGNPELDPQYTDSYEMSYVTKIGKLMLTPNIYYSNTQDNIQRYQHINENGVLISKPINVGSEERYGGDLTFTFKPWKWWNLMGNVNLFGYKTEGKYTDTFTDPDTGTTTSTTTNFDGDGFSWFGRLSSTFTLPSKINFQVSGMYRGGNKTAQSESKAMYGVDLSLSKDLFNDNATISLSVRDLFNTRGRKMTSFGQDFYMESEFRWGVRSYNITFSYRFNQSKKDQKKNQQNGEGEMEGQM